MSEFSTRSASENCLISGLPINQSDLAVMPADILRLRNIMKNKKICIEDDICKLKSFSLDSDRKVDLVEINEALNQDFVVKVSGLEQQDSDRLMCDLANSLGLLDALKLQTSFASILGHRKNEGEYYSTVNQRDNYHYISAHSEGTSKSNIQLASMYCKENTTDGGLSILSKIKQDDMIWKKLGEYSIKIQPGHKPPTRFQIEQAKVFFKVDLLNDLLHADDKIIEEVAPQQLKMLGLNESGIKVYYVISKISKVHSTILNKDIYPYWDSVASHDISSGLGYHQLLEQNELIKRPSENTKISLLDNAAKRRVWDSGVSYLDIIESKLTLKLKAKEAIFFNNLSWTHSSTNWTPNSGNRNVFAAFA